MSSSNNLDTSGDFSAHPLAELIVEIAHAKLTGALRIALESKKSIIYFRAGATVFAVSNLKQHRLFHRLMSEKRIEQSDLRKCSDPANDLELAAAMQSCGRLSEADAREAFASQIREIVGDALLWPQGLWTFSTTARLRADIDFHVNIHSVLLEHSRSMPTDFVMRRFATVDEGFTRNIEAYPDLMLQPYEACVFESFNHVPMTIAEVRERLKNNDDKTVHALYSLWLGGLLVRLRWNKAFSESMIAGIKTARLERVKEAAALTPVHKPVPVMQQAPAEAELPTAPRVALPEISVEEWLGRTARAETHYDVLAVGQSAHFDEIKQSYFALARLFHPDRHHREAPARLREIQKAFTTLADAYETLRSRESRESYDYKVRRELETRREREKAGVIHQDAGSEAARALDSFEHGLKLLGDEDFAGAVAFLGRAVHYNPKNALYHAYLGQALSADGSQLHKAESEMQSAAKLDPSNATIRLMLVQFFIDRNQKRRAEGELKRFLEIAPDNREARALLDGLQSDA